MTNAVATSSDAVQIVTAFTDRLVDQLLFYSRSDPVIRSHTFDANRFADRRTFDAWNDGRRKTYILTDDCGLKLLGLFWVREGDVPKTAVAFDSSLQSVPMSSTYTMAKRLYPDGRGRGYALRLSAAALEDSLKDASPTSICWLSTGAKNHRNMKINQTLGFQPVGVLQDAQILFAASVGQIRFNISPVEKLEIRGRHGSTSLDFVLSATALLPYPV